MHPRTLLLLLAILPELSLASLPAQPANQYREGEVLVKYRADAYAAAAKQLKFDAGLTSRRTLLQGRAELLMLPGFTTTADMLEMLRNDPAVEYAEPNFRRYSRTVVPNDPLFGQQWGLRNTGQANFFAGGPAGVAGGDLNLVEAWDANNDGMADRVGIPGVIVAVIDDAVEITHPDLAPNIVQGHNFIACQDPNNPAPISDDGAHGTLVTGCVAGKGNNGIGIAGVAWNASIMPLKFGFDTASHIEALTYARDHGAKIINASFGGPGFSQMERDAIAALAANDILYVAAAGNDDSNTDLAQLNYPANYDADNIVSVAATNRQDNIASFSQYGPLTADVAAPGLQIVTTEIGGGYRPNPGVSGTSFSSPYTAGVAALIRSHVPGVTFGDIKARLIESGSSVPGANPEQRTAGGTVDADAALDMAAGPSLVIRSVDFKNGDGNRALDPGENLTVEFTLRNIWQNATGVTASLSADNSVTVVSGTLSSTTILAQGEAVATFNISVAAGITDHRYVTFTLTLAAIEGNYTATRSFIAEIGDLASGVPVTQSFVSDPYDEFHAWHVDVPPALPPGIKTLIVRTSTAGGEDIDLLAKAGIPPQYNITVGINPEVDQGFFCTSGTANDCQDPDTLVSGRLDGVEAITIVNPAAGAYHLVVVNFDQQAVPYTISTELVNGDLRPADFNFTDRTGIPSNTSVISNPVIISGIDTPTFITIVGGEYSVNDTPFTAEEGTVSSGQSIRVRANSGSSGSARAQVTVGGVTETFSLNEPPFPSGGSGDVGCPTGGGGGGGGSPGWGLLLIFAGAAMRRILLSRKGIR